MAGICNSAYELALLLIEDLTNRQDEQVKVTFFCGNLRRDELPILLKENKIEVEEIEVYKTTLLLQRNLKIPTMPCCFLAHLQLKVI